MKKMEITKTMNLMLSKAGIKFKKHSPEILMVAGVIGTVTSAVIACRATLKVNDILEEAKESIETIHKVKNDESLNKNYDKEDARKDLAIVYANTGVKLAKLYAPSVLLGVTSITGIIASNNIIRKRNVALGVAYAAVDKSYKDYRSRVKERFGEEVERELRYNIKAKDIEETVIDPETGKEKKTKKTVNVSSYIDCSDYARFFDEGCPDWDKNSEYNLMFLRAQQNYANDLLRSRGYLFLNEVYNLLGMLPSKAGQIVGWIYDPKTQKGSGYVDFGIYETKREANRDFVNGYENVILLDFNVDGNILDFI